MAYNLQNQKRTLIEELLRRKSKALSFILYRFKWNIFPKIGFVSQYPLHVDIEATNRCNLRCIMCIKSSGKNQGNQGDIDFDFACLILEVIKGKVYSIKFNWRGEPLLYKKLPELIFYAKSLGIPEVQINTNGLLLNKKISRELVEAGLDRIIFSVDGHSSETYESIRVGGNYHVLLNNIHGFLLEKRLHKSSFPIVRVQMCVGKENIHEKEMFIKYWSSFGVQVGIIDRQERLKRSGEILVKSVLDYSVRCKQPWQRLTISWEGKVFPCCANIKRNSPLGRIPLEMSVKDIRNYLKEIWLRSPVLNNIRKAIITGDVKNVLCSECPSIISKLEEKDG